MSFSFQQIAVDTASELESLGAGVFGTPQMAIVWGISSPLDGDGGVYRYNSASTATPDGVSVLCPNTITPPSPGRWIRDAKFDRGVPSGAMMMWGTATPPSGWQLCDGSAVSRTTFAALFAVIGTTYGSGDGSTTFNLPDFTQRFPLGKATSGTGANLGDNGGAIDHTHGSPLTTGTPSATVQATILAGGAASTTHTHSVTIPAANPPFLTVNFIIKE